MHARDFWAFFFELLTNLVCDELGKYPLVINTGVNCIRYWFRCLEGELNRLSAQKKKKKKEKACLMLSRLNDTGKNW